MVLSITPAVIVNAGSNEEICQGSTFSFSSQITNASTSNSGSIVWTHSGTGVLFNANTLTPTYVASPTETGILTFTLTAFSTGSCVSISDNMLLTITPAPIAMAGNDDSVCEGTPQFDFSSRTTIATSMNGTALWTHTGSGSLNNNTLTNPIYTIGAADVNTTVTFTLQVTSLSPVCTFVVDQFTLQINRRPTVTLPADFVVCEPVNLLTSPVVLSGVIGGGATTGLWSVVTGAGALGASNLVGTTVNSLYTLDPSDIGTTITLRLTANDPGWAERTLYSRIQGHKYYNQSGRCGFCGT